jgi:hypothetical protein
MKILKKRNKGLVWCEIVRVDSPLYLVSSTQQACHYETSDGKRLAPGYYLAMWPKGACRSLYGHDLRYLGPFATRSVAKLMQVSAVGMSVVDMTVDHTHTVVPIPVPAIPWLPTHRSAGSTFAMA